MPDADQGTHDDQGPSGVFDLDRLKTLIELMQEHDVAEIDLREGAQRIRVSRGGPTAQPVVSYEPQRAAPPPSQTAVPAAKTPAAGEGDGPNIVFIRSPMVGTFYSRANPSAEVFVKVGDHVEPETTVCIVEAMKMFNEIPAEVRGRIVAVLVDDETPVDHGKPLFKVDTSG